MHKTLSTLIPSILIIFLFSQCSGSDVEKEAKALLKEVNQATQYFEDREELFKARASIIAAINRNLLEKDSIVLVESVDKAGIYQCVSYVSHNKMTTFYNARKDVDTTGEYIQSVADTTPYEALSFIDAFQNNFLDQYLQERKEEISESEKDWIITFIIKESKQYTVENYISK